MREKRIAAIILAGGGAKRMGCPKPLLLWKGKPILVHLVEASKEADLDPILIVSGAYHQEIQKVVEGLAVQLIYNPNWEAGQSTSVRTAVAALPQDVGAAIFLLADQPYVTAQLLKGLADIYERTSDLVIAPYIGEQRGNPLLFSRKLFPELLQISGDRGGRVLLGKYPITRLTWHDERILLDIDTPEDYQRLIEME